MKTQFKQSSIKVFGDLFITVNHTDHQEQDIRISLSGSKGKIKSGIYCLRNKLHPERYYIGMARNLETRLQHHFSDLNLNKHKSKLMQKDFNDFTWWMDGVKLPEALFEMEIIIYCRPSELTFYEHLLISALDPYYNTHKSKNAL